MVLSSPGSRPIFPTPTSCWHCSFGGNRSAWVSPDCAAAGEKTTSTRFADADTSAESGPLRTHPRARHVAGGIVYTVRMLRLIQLGLIFGFIALGVYYLVQAFGIQL